jgi:hypothetical protein
MRKKFIVNKKTNYCLIRFLLILLIIEIYNIINFWIVVVERKEYIGIIGCLGRIICDFVLLYYTYQNRNWARFCLILLWGTTILSGIFIGIYSLPSWRSVETFSLTALYLLFLVIMCYRPNKSGCAK